MFFPLTQRKDEVFCYVKIERKRVGSKSFSFFFEVKQKFLRHETFVSLRKKFQLFLRSETKVSPA